MMRCFFVVIFLSFTSSVNAGRVEYESFQEPLGLASLFLSEHPVILEAGAHYGEDTWNMNRVWPHATIHAFEPCPSSFEILANSTAELANVHVWPYALNDVAGQFSFYVVANNDGASSLLPPQEYTKDSYAGPIIVVNAVNLDAWASEQGVDHIDFMWLDMEGAELRMLSSSPNILKSVKVIFTETNFWHCRKGTVQYLDLRAFLEAQGFEEAVHWIAPGQGNAVFVRKELL